MQQNILALQIEYFFCLLHRMRLKAICSTIGLVLERSHVSI